MFSPREEFWRVCVESVSFLGQSFWGCILARFMLCTSNKLVFSGRTTVWVYGTLLLLNPQHQGCKLFSAYQNCDSSAHWPWAVADTDTFCLNIFWHALVLHSAFSLWLLCQSCNEILFKLELLLYRVRRYFRLPIKQEEMSGLGTCLCLQPCSSVYTAVSLLLPVN